MSVKKLRLFCHSGIVNDESGVPAEITTIEKVENGVATYTIRLGNIHLGYLTKDKDVITKHDYPLDSLLNYDVSLDNIAKALFNL